jgi:hypothetical protein
MTRSVKILGLRSSVDAVVRSRHRNKKKLRPGSSDRSELRALFAFDPGRHALLLVAGTKQVSAPSDTEPSYRLRMSCSMSI